MFSFFSRQFIQPHALVAASLQFVQQQRHHGQQPFARHAGIVQQKNRAGLEFSQQPPGDFLRPIGAAIQPARCC